MHIPCCITHFQSRNHHFILASTYNKHCLFPLGFTHLLTHIVKQDLICMPYNDWCHTISSSTRAHVILRSNMKHKVHMFQRVDSENRLSFIDLITFQLLTKKDIVLSYSRSLANTSYSFFFFHFLAWYARESRTYNS